MRTTRSTENQFAHASSGPTLPRRPVTGSKHTRPTKAKPGKPTGFRIFEGHRRYGGRLGGGAMLVYVVSADLLEARFWTTSGSPTIGQLMFKRAVANNRGECFKRVSLSRPSCMTDKGARVALALCGPLQGMVQPPARNASRPPWLKALCRWRICRVAT
jgi:hypothetical protein